LKELVRVIGDGVMSVDVTPSPVGPCNTVPDTREVNHMFDNMEYIYEVYKEGSFSKAAKNLYISQPSLSASVKRVEDRLGYPIFDRSTKPLRLTEIGARYVESMLAIKNIERDFADYVNDYGELKSGSLRLGGTNLVSSLIAPKIISRFKKKYPQISLELVEGNTAGLVEMLKTGSLDMIIDYTMSSYDDYDYRKLTEEHLVLTVPKSLPVNKKLEKYALTMADIKAGKDLDPSTPAVTIDEFKDVPFALLKKNNDTYRRALRICAEAGFEPQISFIAEQQMTAWHVCYSGLGAAFVSSLLLERVSSNSDVVFYRLDTPDIYRQLSILWKKERYLTRSMLEFRKMALEEFGLQDEK